MFQKSSTANHSATSNGQTFDLSAAKLNHLYAGGNVPCLDRFQKFPWYEIATAGDGFEFEFSAGLGNFGELQGWHQ